MGQRLSGGRAGCDDGLGDQYRAMHGCRGGADRCRFAEMRLVKAVWALDWRDGGPCGIAVFGGE